jgi:hypothetical protein
LLGTYRAISGGGGIGQVSPEAIQAIGLTFVALGVTAAVIRHEWMFYEYRELIGNEHSSSLWKDGIPPTRDEYFRYLGQGDFGVVNRFWQAGILKFLDAYGSSDLHIACANGHAAIAEELIKRGSDTRVPDKRGHTPLMLASAEDSLKSLMSSFDLTVL